MNIGQPEDKTADVNIDFKDTNKVLRKAIDVCKTYRKKLIPNWTSNIDYRRGKPFASQTDEDRVVVNLDWSLTKAKQASLFSQIPQIRISHFPQTTQVPWLSAFQQRVNDTFVQAGIESAMDECLPDVINAAGIAAVLVSHEVLTESRQIPAQDFSQLPPEIHQQILQTGQMPDGTPVEMVDVPVTTDHRYLVSRVSPSDLLWPITFSGSDFDHAPWIGHTGRCYRAQAKQILNLTDEQIEKVAGESKTYLDKMTHDIDKDKEAAEDVVEYDQLFVKEHYFNPECKLYDTIRRVVFVPGIDEPVIDEPWKGQDMSEGDQPQLIGALKSPLRILTLTYISDEAIPPSDSAIGRPQVNEINKSRTQMILQRERSLPLRWINSDRMDPMIMQAIMKGTWQTIIPVQGDGTRVVGEVARASMPQEDFTFDQIAKSDLTEGWQIGPNQQGSFGQGRQSATESNVVEANFQTRIGRERAKVAKFVVSIAEVLGGLIALYEPAESIGQGFDPSISRTLGYSILADSTVLIDSQQRLQRLQQFVDFTAKSGYLNIGPVLKEIASLSGVDPNVAIQDPQPKPPVEPNISLRLTGSEDLSNPIVVATLMKSGQFPDAKLIEEAKKLITLAGMAILEPPVHDPNQPPTSGQPPQGPNQGVPPPNGQQPPGAEAPTAPSPQPPRVGDANPRWALMNKISKRSDGQEG